MTNFGWIITELRFSPQLLYTQRHLFAIIKRRNRFIRSRIRKKRIARVQSRSVAFMNDERNFVSLAIQRYTIRETKRKHSSVCLRRPIAPRFIKRSFALKDKIRERGQYCLCNTLWLQQTSNRHKDTKYVQISNKIQKNFVTADSVIAYTRS